MKRKCHFGSHAESTKYGKECLQPSSCLASSTGDYIHCQEKVLNAGDIFVIIVGPLAGIKVLDLTHTLSGPMATMILGDYGAEVIKVERPGSGDETRSWGPPFVGSEASGNKESAYYLCLNRNKRSLTLNIKDPRGQEIMHKLAREADVFIANFPAGKLKKYQLGWEDMHKINDQLVYLNITGYGESGPYANRAAYDLIMEGETGLTDLVSRLANSKAPLTAGLPVADIFTALYAQGAVMAGLLRRQTNGKGTYLETSLFECQMAALTNYASNVLLSKHNGNNRRIDDSSHHPTLTPYQPVPAEGGEFFNIAANNDAQFAALCTVLGHPEWAKDSRFSSNSQRTAHRAELIKNISEVTEKQPASYWIRELNSVGVPCGRINTIGQALSHPQMQPCQMIQTVQHSQLGPIDLVGPAVKVQGKIGTITAPPALGEHTNEILQELSYSQEEIEKLRQDGVI